MKFFGVSPLGYSIEAGEITDGTITNVKLAATTILNNKINASAAIDYSKLAALASAKILVGSAGNVPTAVDLSSHATIDNAGAITIADNVITLAKMAAGTDGNLITYDASGDPAAVATGTANQVLTSNGAGAAPTFQAAAGGGHLTLVSTITFSAEATKSYTSLTERGTFILFYNLTGASGNITINLRLNANSGNNYAWTKIASGTSSESTGQSSISIGNVDATDKKDLCGVLVIDGRGTNDICVGHFGYSSQGAGVFLGGKFASGGDNPLTGITILASASTLSGKMTLYYINELG